MKRKLTCIICPRGCDLWAEGEAGVLKVTGNACPKGEAYAISECTNPIRTVTSVIRVANRRDTMVSVKTESPIPKDKIFDVMERIRTAAVQAPVKIGDILLADICETNILATKNID